MFSHCIGSNSKNLPNAATPALLINISIEPNCPRACYTAWITAIISVTSAVNTAAITPKALTSSATSSMWLVVLASNATLTPSLAKALVIALPVPAPVTSAFFPFSDYIKIAAIKFVGKMCSIILVYQY